jgi:hypothetical protein
MRRAEATARVAVEIFVEPVEIAIVIRPEGVAAGKFEGPPAVSIAKPKADLAIR